MTLAIELPAELVEQLAARAAEMEEKIGTPARQWHPVLAKLESDGVVERSGEGKKGDPYRFRILRSDAAQPPAQHPRSNGTADALSNAALSVGEQQKAQQAAASSSAPTCAETNGNDLAYLESLAIPGEERES